MLNPDDSRISMECKKQSNNYNSSQKSVMVIFSFWRYTQTHIFYDSVTSTLLIYYTHTNLTNARSGYKIPWV